jgi:REP element-mobilizing transposase RayT
MPRRPAYLAGRYYHLYNRGAHRVSVFREPDNYLYVLHRIKKYVKAFHIDPIAYCLLPNHYHLLVRQGGRRRASLLPQSVFNGYSKAYNKRYGHSGTLFEGPCRVRTVEDESHLLHLCRYIHANPVRHGLVPTMADWPYSNYLEWIGERAGSLVDRRFVLAHFESPEQYSKFVHDYVLDPQLPRALQDHLDDWER